MENRGILARLMAVENITVEHRNTQTASFDVMNRVLTLPTWKAMSTELYDLLRAHEVGHALETPAEGWHGTVLDNRALKTFLNVVEDARIERLIKNRYPGLRPSFVKGYKELFDRDFFGARNKDLNSLLLVDRINLHFKIGSHLNVPFSETEQDLVDRVAQVQTWSDVVALAKEIYDLDSEELNNMLEQSLMEFGNAELDDDADLEYEDYAEDYDEEPEPQKVGGVKAGGNKNARPSKILDDWYSFNDVADQGPVSMTDTIFHERELELLTDDIQPRVYVNVPTVKLNKVIVPYRQVLAEFIFRLQNTDLTEETLLKRIQYKEFKTNFMVRNKRFVEHMIREFEIRRNARQLARAGTAKTGALNMKKIHQYKLTDDLFQRLTVVPKGKNHGMIMVFDQSGSMGDYYAQTLEQIVVLSMFCRGISIPFHVYGFTDNRDHVEGNFHKYYDESVFSENIGELAFHGNKTFRLREYFSHAQSSSEFKAMQDRVLQMACIWRMRSGFFTNMLPASERLCGTPLNETIVSLMEIIPEFKKVHKLDVVNCMLLTDGESNSSTLSWAKTADKDPKATAYVHRYAGPTHLVLRHHKSKIEQSTLTLPDNRDGRTTAALVRLLADVTGARTMGYFISTNFKHHVREWFKSYADRSTPLDAEQFADSVMSEIRKHGFFKTHDGALTGYQSYFRVSSKFLDFKEEELDSVSVSNTARDLRKAFLKLHGDKRKHRILLSNFIEQIA